MNKVVMVIAAHPDDIEFTCCGTISRLLKQGYTGVYVVVSNGESGFKIAEQPREIRVKTREKEQMAAAKVIGVRNVLFLHQKDSFIKNDDNLRKRLVSLIKKYKPNIVVTFDPANKEFNNINLHHRDHRRVAECVFDSVFAAKNKYIFPGEPWKVDEMYFFGTAKPNYFVDISDIIDLKIKALSMHKSQFSDFEKTRRYILKWTSENTKEYKHSEAFRIIKIRQI